MSGKVSKLILNTNKVMNEKDKAHDNMPFNWEMYCFLHSKNWILKYYLDEHHWCDVMFQ
jgi:hypothetical protein